MSLEKETQQMQDEVRQIQKKVENVSIMTNFFTLWCNSINLINEQDGWWVFLAFLKCLSKIGFRLSREFRHDFRTCKFCCWGARIRCIPDFDSPFRRKKNAPVSLATALAISVLPVPGGPNKRIPRGGLIPIALNSCGWRSGSSTISLICASCLRTWMNQIYFGGPTKS